MTSLPSESYDARCRRRFLRLCAQVAAIDLNAPTQRKANARKRVELLSQIDLELDCYNAWLELGGVPYELTLEQGL